MTWITPKASGYNRTKIESPFEIDLFDGAGRLLGTYPIDLSRFDTDPARIGKPLRVEGCEVLDSSIVTIVNVWARKYSRAASPMPRDSSTARPNSSAAGRRVRAPCRWTGPMATAISA